MNKISIIIPILNEATTIETLLKHLYKNSQSKNIAEIIVADGGSTDGSQKIVATFPEVNLVNSAKGRAKQMNLGAKYATGNILYFLHADSFPPNNFDTYILNEFTKGHLAGCFIMKFNYNHWWLKLVGYLTKLPWQICRGGDQSLFITKKLFDDIGGYNENYTIYEDNILINELYKINQFKVIPRWLTTDARRYKNLGVFKLQYHFFVIHLKQRFGANANELYLYYKKHIS
ncbi:TIGR04283 family arsenosugar biosynthesis glycosyltransferase [Aestuariibaculum sediminum]|uniref:TIGR04283 family arsenosugar biosynthesis glycosyltransferase n=1 Tax=Aestuariibaculum sediminum TaxID=2770637 RepID=A0A8J6Q161_9FLAO|nr:TIGR04283 family arsenosugar biosynthesis glycosyltransferase [Aestuariibaculum sediminum]MBD0830779.1 TIGR04283 family arsenosugar biosynthesis glycosyltransferase [Aestuariibaculum sediminum]